MQLSPFTARTALSTILPPLRNATVSAGGRNLSDAVIGCIV